MCAYIYILLCREKKIKNVKIYINAYKPPFNITKQIIFHLIYIIHKKNLNNLIFLDIYIEKKNKKECYKMFSIRLVIIISCCLVYAYSQEIFKLATACSKKSLELDELMVLDNEDIISKDVTNSCKLLINNTRFYSNGFILRINLNSTIGPDSFSMNLTNNSNQLVYKFDKSFNTSPILIKVYTSLFFEINMKSSNQFEFIKSIVITSFNDTKNGNLIKFCN
jgi:predicted MPP superfamily phosphohydrolase